MTMLALSLVLAAAVIHASWNYLLKRSGGGTVFVWLFATLSALIYAPLAAFIIGWQQPEFGWVHYGLMFASAALIPTGDSTASSSIGSKRYVSMLGCAGTLSSAKMLRLIDPRPSSSASTRQRSRSRSQFAIRLERVTRGGVGCRNISELNGILSREVRRMR